MDAHPLANLIPEMPPDQWAAFLADVKANGVREPAVTLDGLILDGRNRWRAAQEAGIKCPTRPFDGTDPLGFVLSLNVHRRHLTTCQRAAIAAEVANMQHGTNQHTKKVEGSIDPSTSITIEAAAKMLNVSRKSVVRAREVMHTDPEAHEAAKRGENPKSKPESSPGYLDLAQRHGLLRPNTWSGARHTVRDEIARRTGISIETLSRISKSAEDSAPIEVACIAMAEAKKKPEQREHELEELRSEMATAPKKWQTLYEHTLAKERAAIDAKIASGVEAKVASALVVEHARCDQLAALHIQEAKAYQRMRNGMRGLVSLDDYRLLLNTLHPDREPNREKLAKAFLIVRAMQPYFDAMTRPTTSV